MFWWGNAVAIFHLARSRYFIIDDYYFPIYVIKPREDVEIIQLWHSAGALKKFGLSIDWKTIRDKHGLFRACSDTREYSKAYVSSNEVVPFFAEAFNVPKEQILPLGVPRTDYFYEKKRLIHYAPIFIKTFLS